MPSKIEMAHLHLHSSYSALDAVSKITDIVKRAVQYGHKAIALTDHGTISGVPEFYNECKKQKIKPILAQEFYFQPDAKLAQEEKNRKNHHLILLAMNQEGWTNIKKLTTKASDKFYYAPRIDYSDLREHSNGLICLTACLKGIVPYNIAEEKYDDAFKHAKELHDIFGDRFYLETQDGGLNIQPKVNEVMRRFAAQLGVKVVGCQDAHYVDRDDVEAHEGIWAIRTYNTFDDPIKGGPQDNVEGQKYRPYYSTREYWLKDAHHMLNEPLTTEDNVQRASSLLQSEIEESAAIADRIGDVVIEKKMHLPRYEFVPDHSQVGCAAKECIEVHSETPTQDLASFNYLCELVMKGYERTYKCSWFDRTDEHRERLARELKDIKEAGLADYFLIIWDIATWAQANGIPMGPGRGCLTTDSFILADGVLKPIQDVQVGETVVNSLGQKVKVVNKASFDVSENVVDLKTYCDFYSTCSYTKDHKILVKRGDVKKSKKGRTLFASQKPNEWVMASEINKGDYFCIPKLKYGEANLSTVDLADFTSDSDIISEDVIVERVLTNKQKETSMRALQRATGIARNTLLDVRKQRRKTTQETLEKLVVYLQQNNIADSISEWISLIERDKFEESYLPRFLCLDEDFSTFLGLWIGDGCYHNASAISIALNETDYEALDFLRKYLSETLQVRYTERLSKKKKTLINFDIQSGILNRYFKSVFGLVYSDTKFVPEFVFARRETVRGLVRGLVWSDGCERQNRITFTTTSFTLMSDFKRLLYHMGSTCSVIKRIYPEDTNCTTSYACHVAKTQSIIDLFGNTKSVHRYYFEDDDFVYVAVRDIKSKSYTGKVFDLAVAGPCQSFLTSSYIVHNSAAGSMVSYCIGITGVDPLKYGLIWERFYNAGRKGSLADIDLDFSQKDRKRVIEYIRERFGENRVAQIVTFNTLGSKAVLKDTAKILGSQGGIPYEDANVMTRFVPLKHGAAVTLKEALEESDKLKEYAEKYPRLFRVAQKLEGCPKNRGTHAAGVVISDEPFENGFPLCWNAREQTKMTEWDMETLDSLGYLKVDVLGIKTLDVLDDIERQVNGE